MSENSKSLSPLTDAIWDRDYDLVLTMLEQISDINAPIEENEFNPILVAASAGALDILKLLENKGGNLFSCTSKGKTLLHTASVADYSPEMMVYLLENGLNPNFRDINGWTPVHIAVKYNNLDGLKQLLEGGGNPYYPTNNGETSFDLAEESGYQIVIDLLESFRERYEPPESAELERFVSQEDSDDQTSISLDNSTVINSEYIVEEDHSGRADSEALVRASITQWADAIPHHGIKQMGKAVKIKEIHYRPAYLLGLTSLYDNRVISENSVPYTGQAVPERLYSSTSQVDLWDFSLMEANQFQNAQNSYIVDGTQHVEQCSTCSGHGELTCPSCGGKGKSTCHSCGGKGETRCSSCYGSGSRSCSSCGGSGRTAFSKIDTHYDSEGNAHHNRYVEYHSCSGCGGSGKNRCSTCGGRGTNSCSSCGGSGIVVCSRCSGSGRITCPTCQGRGKMYHFYSIEQTLAPQSLTRCILEAHVFEEFPRFYIDPLENTGALLKDETVDSLPESLLDTTHLHSVFKEIMKQSLSHSPFDQNGGATRRVLQNAKIVQMDVYHLYYTFQEQDYQLLVWGWGDQFQVYAQKSPFSEMRDRFLEKAEKRFSLRIWGKCFNWLDKADDMDIHNEEARIYELKEMVETKMYRQYRWGLIVGSILSGCGISFFSLNFFKKDHYLHPRVKDLFQNMGKAGEIHPIVMTVLFLLMLLLAQNRMYRFMKKYYNNSIRHEWLRWIFPLIIAFGFSILIWSGIWAVNASGISLFLSKGLQGILNFGTYLITWMKSL